MKCVQTYFSNKLLQFESQNEKYAAPLYITAGILIDSTLQMIVKKTSMIIFQTLMFRGIMIVVINYSINKNQFYLDTKHEQKTLLVMISPILCTFLGAIQSILYYMGVKILSLSETTVLYLTYSIWAQFLATFILKESLTVRRMRNCLVSISGVILVTKPSIIFGKDDNIKSNDQQLLGFCYVLFASFIHATSSILMKKLGVSIPASTKLQYYHLQTIMYSTICLLYFYDDGFQKTISIQDILSVSLIALSTYSNHLLTFRAYSLRSLAKLAPYTFIFILMSIIYDYTIYDCIPDFVQTFGISLIVFAILLNLLQNND